MKPGTNSIQQPWSSDIADIFAHLKTNSKGLSPDEIKLKTKEYGKNIFTKKERKGPLSILLKQFANPLIFILIGAVIITGVLKEWVEVFVIGLAVLINAGLGFYREYHAEHTLEELSSFIKERALVIREGHEQEVDSEFIVPGDIIKLSYGSRVPADARLINMNSLRLNEAILTGESKPIEKTESSVPASATVAERTNMVHAGTLVIDGFGTALVVATGNNTEIGKIAGLVSDTKRAKTPIQKGLERLAWIIFAVVIFIVIGIFTLGTLRGEPLLEMLILSVAVSVGAVPEALPIALTVILSIGAERIARKKGIVRTLIATETLGSTSLIMTDKTGTLTEADMRLVGIYTSSDLELETTETDEHNTKKNYLLERALENVDILIENPNDPVSKWTFKGKPFEVNIVKTAKENGIDISYLGQEGSSLPIVIPFNSTHKFSAAQNGDSFTVMGAPDVLLARSQMSKDNFIKIESWITQSSSEGKRLIALAKMNSKKDSLTVADVKDLEFLGILAFHDPVRKNIKESISKIESLGTKIIMITGDLKGTAMSVAKELGWNITDNQVLTGHDIQSMTDEELLKIIPDKKIYARVTPEDKLRIGSLYRQLGEVVAMTGDGVNDAPALKAMDIGVAIGSGSDVAKSAADLVLLDDNFEIITTSIQEGRRMLGNIRKTFVYLMSNSLDSVFVIGGSLLLGLSIPLTALQIIWVNLFTGSLPALAYAYDEDFDHEKTKDRTLKSIFTNEVNVLTFGVGLATSALLFFMYYALLSYGVELELAKSIFFVCFASYILAISFSFRSLKKPLFSYPMFSNKKLNQSIILAVLILLVTLFVPFMREVFDLVIIPLEWLWFIALWLVVNIALVEGAKFFFRLRNTAR